MKLAAILRDTYHLLTRHPLNRDRKLAALIRYVRWQIGSLAAPGQVAVKFVNDSLLLGDFGMTSVSGNVFTGLWEFEDEAFVLHLLRKQDLFVDVGANVGVYTVMAGAAVGASCVAIEPAPETFRQLQMNVRINGIGDHVETHNVGAGDRDGTLRLTRGLGAMNRFATDADRDVIEVPVRTLDGLVGTRAVTMLKIDVEGFETKVIEGAEAVLSQPSLLAIIMEQNGSGARFGFDESALHRRILDAGFVACAYEPFSRSVRELDADATVASANRLYLRDLDRVRARLASAPRYDVDGRSI